MTAPIPDAASLQEAVARAIALHISGAEHNWPLWTDEAQIAIALVVEACAAVADQQKAHAEQLAREEITDVRVTVIMASERIASAIRKLAQPGERA